MREERERERERERVVTVGGWKCRVGFCLLGMSRGHLDKGYSAFLVPTIPVPFKRPL